MSNVPLTLLGLVIGGVLGAILVWFAFRLRDWARR